MLPRRQYPYIAHPQLDSSVHRRTRSRQVGGGSSIRAQFGTTLARTISHLSLSSRGWSMHVQNSSCSAKCRRPADRGSESPPEYNALMARWQALRSHLLRHWPSSLSSASSWVVTFVRPTTSSPAWHAVNMAVSMVRHSTSSLQPENARMQEPENVSEDSCV